MSEELIMDKLQNSYFIANRPCISCNILEEHHDKTTLVNQK